MALRKARPKQFSPFGACDAIDGTNVQPGAMAALTNLIPDPTTKDVWVCRPASISLTTLAAALFGSSQTFVSAAIQVGTRIYGMVATSGFNGGKDIPFSYNVATNQFDPISGMLIANLPTSPPTTGDWVPPTMSLVGTYVVVTHPGFTFGPTQAFGLINISTPTAPVWSTTNTTTNPLAALPNFVANFNGRAYFLVNPAVGQPFALFTDINDPTSASGNGPTAGPVVPVITFDDNELLVAAAPLGLFNQLGGVVQALMVFKATTNIYQITGDIANPSGVSSLAKNALNVATGTSSPLAIATTPRGLAFLAPDGLRLIDFYARISDPIGVDGQGINAPFLNILHPSRAQAACNQNVLRVSMQFAGTQTSPGQPQQDWWYDISRNKWSGPHSFPAAQIVPFGATFIMTGVGVNNALFQSDVVQSLASTFVENGVSLTWAWQSCFLPDPGAMAYFDIPEATLNLAMVGSGNVAVTVTDQDGNVLGQATATSPLTASNWDQFEWGLANWGAGVSNLFPRQLDWSQPLVGRRMQFTATGASAAGVRVGDLFMRYRDLGYMFVEPASTVTPAFVLDVSKLGGVTSDPLG